VPKGHATRDFLQAKALHMRKRSISRLPASYLQQVSRDLPGRCLAWQGNAAQRIEISNGRLALNDHLCKEYVGGEITLT
jgi:hypothetical protein